MSSEKFRPQRFLPLILLAVAFSTLAACSGSSDPPSTNTAGTGAPASAPPSAASSITPTATATATATATPTSTPTAGATLPPIQHVFIIVLENENEGTTFSSTSPAKYLNNTLVPSGAFIPNYFGTGHESLDNYISMVSGQAPNPQTQGDCQGYTDFVGNPTAVSPDSNGQAVGNGCVYPGNIKTIADQLTVLGFKWGGFMEDMGNDLARDGTTNCAHPSLNQRDPTQSAEAADQYAARHNPFIYFHSLIDGAPSDCSLHDVPLGTATNGALSTALQSVGTTPNYVFITPNLCNDGHDTNCANGDPGGLTSADSFLHNWVPLIQNSPAYKQDGMLAIIFDEALGPPNGDSSSCCGEQPGPNTTTPGINGAGGGQTGAIILSKFIKAGTVTNTSYNHYSLLRTIEDIFGAGHLGFAGQAGLQPFGGDVFTASP